MPVAGDNWTQLLGLARRAGQLLAGTETVSAAARQGRIALLIAAVDLSDKTRERLDRLARAHGIRLIFALDRHQLSSATGYPGRGVFGVTGIDLARAVISAWEAQCPAGGVTEGGIHHS